MDLILLQDSISINWSLIWQGVIEKGISGLLVAVIGGIGAKYVIEKSKNKWTLSTEVNKVKVHKIAECWGNMSGLQVALFILNNKLVMALSQIKPGDKIDDKTKNLIKDQLFTDCNCQMEDLLRVKALMLSHKFWFNDEIYEASQQHFEKYEKYYDYFCKEQYWDCLKEWEEIQEDLDNGLIGADKVVEKIIKHKD
ncbi:MAG: hypothetical protein AAF388_18135 [Bacteroidota bacterium]